MQTTQNNIHLSLSTPPPLPPPLSPIAAFSLFPPLPLSLFFRRPPPPLSSSHLSPSISLPPLPISLSVCLSVCLSLSSSSLSLSFLSLQPPSLSSSSSSPPTLPSPPHSLSLSPFLLSQHPWRFPSRYPPPSAPALHNPPSCTQPCQRSVQHRGSAIWQRSTGGDARSFVGGLPSEGDPCGTAAESLHSSQGACSPHSVYLVSKHGA